MKKLKSIMCKVMSVIILCTFILPLIPAIDVKAASTSETISKTNGIPDTIKAGNNDMTVIQDLSVYYDTPKNNIYSTDGSTATYLGEASSWVKDADVGVVEHCYDKIFETLTHITIKEKQIDLERSDIPTSAEIVNKFGDTKGIYYYYDHYHNNDTGGELTISCDYSETNKKYYYIVLFTEYRGAHHTAEDDFLLMTFESSKMMKMSLEDEITTHHTRFINVIATLQMGGVGGIIATSLNGNVTSDGDITLSAESSLQLLSGLYDKSKIQNDLKNGSINDRTMYSNLEEYITYNDTDRTVSIATPYELHLVADNNKVDLTLNDETNTVLCTSGSMPEANELTEFIDFGDMRPNSDKCDIITQFFMNIFCDLCKTDGVEINQFQDKLNTLISNIGNDSPLSKILGYYADKLAKESEGTRLTQEYNNQNPITGDFAKIDSTDMYKVMSFILGYNIYCINDNSVNFNSGKYITIGDDRRIHISTNWEDKDALQLSIKDVWDSLSESEKAVLYTMYVNNIADYTGSEYIHGVKLYNPDYTYDSSLAEDFAQENPTLLDDCKNTVSNRDKNLNDTNMVYNIARNSNTITQYLIATKLYGEGSNNGSIYDIYDETMAALVASLGQYNIEYNPGYWPYHLPGSYGLFGTDSKYLNVLNSSQDGVSAFVKLMQDVSYAFDVAAFSENAQEKYDPKALRVFFRSGKYEVTDAGKDYATTVSFSWVTGDGVGSLNGKTVQFSGDDVSKNMLRSIIELHDMCEFLGILDSAKNGGWTEAIAEYLGIYDDNPEFFAALRANSEIYTKAEEGKTTADEPLGVFFNLKDKKMSDQWCKGFAISALYVPMETNLYDANSIAYLNDPNFISDFYYKFAFYRKALFINTNNSAIVNNKVSGEVSGTRVATLNDLLNYDRDIILTIDDNFYNAKDINSVIGGLDYSAVRNGSSTNTDNAWDSMKNWVGDLFNLSPEQILKTGANSYYSSTLANSVTKLGGTVNLASSIADVYVLSENDIIGENSVFNDYEYSVKQSYGVVSAVYRSAELYNECLRALATDNAIFKSSKGICSTPGTTSSDWRSIYNYCMLSNLEEQMKNDSASTLDLNAPIFCDLFGNIVTESGLVIIPAATNATLCGTNWNPNTVGWSEYYNNGNRLKIDEFTDDVYTWITGIEYESDGSVEQQVQYVDHYDNDGNPVYKSYTITAADTTSVGKYGQEVNRENAGGYMIVDRSGDLVLRTSALASGSSSAIVQWENLNKNSTVVKDLFYNDAYFNKAKSGDIYSKTLVNMVVETLRGAPIEYIDYEYEGLSGNTDISKFGVYMAYKLEELTNALTSGTNGSHIGGNSMVTIPNPAFIPGIEYIALYVFKIMFAILLIGFVISLYMDAVKNHLGIKSLGKFVVTCLLTIVAIVFVPNIMSWSYYRANKDLLADESGYIMMLNYVKDYDGAEIGITSVTTPETNTELYVKLDDISVNWWDVIGEVLFNNTYKTVSELYKSQLTDNAMAMQENVQIKGDGLYMNVQDIFDSTSVVYYPSQNRIANIAYSNSNRDSAGDKDSVVSFCMPYYVILDRLVANVDEYNQSKDITAYSWSVGSNGHIMTYDIISPYLTSSEFLDEGYDILGLNEALSTDRHMTSYTEGYFTAEQKAKMKLSRWYPTGSTTDQMTQDRINAVYSYARDYIAQNRAILGKVPDEVFIKTFAMQLAIEFNKQFNVHTTNSIEIMNVDTRDLARFLVADKGSVYKYFSYGFSRFTYEESGTIGVILSAIYFVVLWLTSWLKLIAIFFVLFLLILNVLLRKTLLRRESRCIEGYLISCACLVLCNYAYSFMLKASMLVSETGLGTVAGLSLAILVQVLYVFGLTCICVIQVKDWRNNGFNSWKNVGAAITSEMLHVQNVVADKVMSMISSSYGDSKTSRRYQSGNYDSNSVDEMMERDEEREERGTYSPA